MDERRTARSYLGSIVLGGFAGAIAIIVAVIAELAWECKYWNRGCYDGQGGIVLVVLVPFMFVVGSILGCSWAWLKSKLPPTSILSSNYAGSGKPQNRVIGFAVSTGLWCAICFGLFLALIYVDRF